MLNIVQKLRSSGSIGDRLRGLPVFKEELVFPSSEQVIPSDEETMQEIRELHAKNVPLAKVLKVLKDENMKKFARELYFGIKEPLTKVSQK